jgi:polyhydroxyalkanoate synthesis regulator phasin
LVEEKTAKELKKLFANLVDHTYGHHQSIDGLTKRIVELERRVKNLEARTKHGQPKP